MQSVEVKLLNKKIPISRKFMVSLTAAIFLGPLARKTQEVPHGNGYLIVSKNSLGSTQLRCSFLSESQGGL